MHQAEVPGRERVPLQILEPEHIDVVIFPMPGIEPGRLCSHRRIDGYRQDRNSTLVFELSQIIDKQLRASDGERRDDDLAATLGRRGYYLGQAILWACRIVLSVAIC